MHILGFCVSSQIVYLVCLYPIIIHHSKFLFNYYIGVILQVDVHLNKKDSVDCPFCIFWHQHPGYIIFYQSSCASGFGWLPDFLFNIILKSQSQEQTLGMQLSMQFWYSMWIVSILECIFQVNGNSPHTVAYGLFLFLVSCAIAIFVL